jgi:hypothetical protein
MRGQIMPPEALITSPVTHSDSSGARNTAALAVAFDLPQCGLRKTLAAWQAAGCYRIVGMGIP